MNLDISVKDSVRIVVGVGLLAELLVRPELLEHFTPDAQEAVRKNLEMIGGLDELQTLLDKITGAMVKEMG